ncbi:MAG: DegT/DnrJ/EryC1/StrS family aminotransferase, partial [Candidatus Omnitrophica bacterium]|nr:DegT/DnrJ/EryC1/StrS family aminotransferase [Candidatus Omnitrophota bacterium]
MLKLKELAGASIRRCMDSYNRLSLRLGPHRHSLREANRRWWPRIGEEEINAVLRLLYAGELSLISEGGVIEQMAHEFTRFFGTTFAVPQNSGTSTLHAAYFALGIGPGDEVIVPSATFHASVAPILMLGAQPVFCEIEPKTLTLDPGDLERRITERTKAVCVVHWYGLPAEMRKILAICRRRGLRVVEDASQAHGATVDGEFVGTLGDVGCMSLQQQKGIAAGEGGVLLTNNPELYDRTLLLGHFGLVGTKGVTDAYADIQLTGCGFKYRIHPLAAALAVEQVKKFRHKLEGVQRYCALLEEALIGVDGLTVMKPHSNTTRGAYQWGFPVSIEKLAAVSEFQCKRFFVQVANAGVGIGRPTPMLHLDRRFRDRIDFSKLPPYPAPGYYKPGSLPVTERIYPTLVVLEQHVSDVEIAVE